jgi:hypothetical protein
MEMENDSTSRINFILCARDHFNLFSPPSILHPPPVRETSAQIQLLLSDIESSTLFVADIQIFISVNSSLD